MLTCEFGNNRETSRELEVPRKESDKHTNRNQKHLSDPS
jgi:hypothetical protein